MKKMRKRIGLAVVVLTLIVGSAGQARAVSASTFNASFEVGATSTVEIDNTYFLYASPGATPPNPTHPIPWAMPLSPIPAGTPVDRPFQQEVDADPASHTQYSTLIGTYTNPNTSETGVMLTIDNTAAANILTNNTSWDSLFPSSTEASIVTALQTGDTATLLSFFTSAESLAQVPIWTGGPSSWTLTGTLIGFSDPAAYGNSTTSGVEPTAVPEPSTMVSASIVVLMGIGYGQRRRKQAATA